MICFVIKENQNWLIILYIVINILNGWIIKHNLKNNDNNDFTISHKGNVSCVYEYFMHVN
jgi:hypothetical protein